MSEEREIDLFDLLLVVADNLKLLVLGPLMVGLTALAICYVQPKIYTSQALLNLGDSAKAVEAMMRSPTVLDVVLKQFPSPLGVSDRARDELANKIQLGTGSTSQKAGAGITKLEVENESPARAQGLANALIDAWLATTKPPPESRLELMRKLKLNQDALEMVSQLLKRMASETTSLIMPNVQFELATPTAQLLQLRNGYVDAIAAIEAQLRGQTRDVVASPPSLPTEATKPNKSLIAVLAALGCGFVLLLWVFFRQAWKDAAQDPETLKKIVQLRAAMKLPRWR